MTPSAEAPSSRERIVDAAARVMREEGLAGATTKAIAAAAGYSEAMLYKHFADKQELFLAVLKERLPSLGSGPQDPPGTGELKDRLAHLVEQLLGFFVETFPLAASIFGAPKLLEQHREGLRVHGAGPIGPVLAVKNYLDAERDLGRVSSQADTETIAQTLVGFAFHQAFLAAFEGDDRVTDAADRARAVVAAVSPALTVP